MYTLTGSDVVLAQGITSVWQRIAAPFVNKIQTIATCGLTPQKLALTLCVGVALGVMPLVWGTSLICIMLAHLFRLNHIALQSINFLMYPLQLALLIPFFNLGAWLFPWGPAVTPHAVLSIFRNHDFSLHTLGWITLKSLSAWIVVVSPTALLAYGILLSKASRKAGQISCR